ncbi:MAG: hypothetical protein C3F11_07240 [Methylocystaceae bacterium]|nr:MAG: hypothetical protein C3F11_07240 [Methylocystaceae bacterium]
MQWKLRSLLVAASVAGFVGSAAAFPRVVTDLAAFRSGPGLGFLPILAIPPQAVVDVTDCFRGWCRATYNGKDGFIASSLLARRVAEPAD